jgi:hypothetical protein
MLSIEIGSGSENTSDLTQAMKIENSIRSDHQFKEVASPETRSDFANNLRLMETPLGNQSGAGDAGMLQTISNNNPVHTHLREIASRTDFSDAQRTQGALLEAARSMIEAQLGEGFPRAQAENMINDMSQAIARDPILKQKLTSVLFQLRSNE